MGYVGAGESGSCRGRGELVMQGWVGYVGVGCIIQG